MTDRIDLLYVDDDIDIRTVATLALGLDGAISTRPAESGAEALAMLHDGNWRPDAVLLDVMMPGMDGPAFLAEVRRLPGLETIPVIFMTARSMQADVAHYYALGAAGVIVKPFDPLRLAEEVRALIEAAS
jgi:CheY-like chemotaxis protein